VAVLQFCTTSSFPVPMDTVHRQMVEFSRVRIRVSVRISVRLSFSGSNLQEPRARLLIRALFSLSAREWMVNQALSKLGDGVHFSRCSSLRFSERGSFDECRLSARWPPTLGLRQPTWAVSLPVCCYHSHTPSPFIITAESKS